MILRGMSGASSGACLGHVWGITWGMSGHIWGHVWSMSGTCLGHHLGHVWGMSGTTSGAYCQQWTTIRGATCICDAVFSTAGALRIGAVRESTIHPAVNL